MSFAALDTWLGAKDPNRKPIVDVRGQLPAAQVASPLLRYSLRLVSKRLFKPRHSLTKIEIRRCIGDLKQMR